VRVHVGDGRDADARRLDHVDGVDADAWTDVARRHGLVPWHVGRDDGGDDAAVLGPNAVTIGKNHHVTMNMFMARTQGASLVQVQALGEIAPDPGCK